MKIAVVTGASSGLGREFVKQISKKYKTIEEIWLIARREDRMDELALSIPSMRFKILPLDLTNDEDLLKYKSALLDEKPNVRLLINASGYGKTGHFTDTDISDSVGMIDLNCSSLVKMTYMTLPYMSCPGNIIQLASSAAFMPQPSFAIYAASKSFVLSFSRALNVELQNRAIKVTSVCPGPVDTEFFGIAEEKEDIKIYKKVVMAEADKVVEKALIDANLGKDMSVYGLAIKGLEVASKTLPHGPIIKFIK